MAFSHLVSCNQEIEDLIREKNISPSQAFQLGVKKMAFGENFLSTGDTIEKETILNKTIQARDKLQALLFQAQEDLDKLKEGKK